MSFTKKHATYISMITLFAKNGRVIEAQQLFDRTSHKNIISWNNMSVGHLHNNTVEQANKLFELMFKKKAICSWASISTCYMHQGKPEKTRKLFELVPENCLFPLMKV